MAFPSLRLVMGLAALALGWFAAPMVAVAAVDCSTLADAPASGGGGCRFSGPEQTAIVYSRAQAKKVALAWQSDLMASVTRRVALWYGTQIPEAQFSSVARTLWYGVQPGSSVVMEPSADLARPSWLVHGGYWLDVRDPEALSRIIRVALGGKPPLTVSSMAGAEGMKEPAWVAEQPSAEYTIQLLAVLDRRLLSEFAHSHHLAGPLAYFVQTFQGVPLYTLVFGRFRDAIEARKMLSSLPEGVRQQGPWVRSFGEIQQIMIRPAGSIGDTQ